MTTVLFYLFSVLLLGSAMFVVLNRQPVYSVVMLVFAFANLSGIYFLLDAYFIGILQILVYAGAIMVLFLFVVMLLNVSPEKPRARWVSLDRWWFGTVAALFIISLGVILVRGVGRMQIAESEVPDGFGDITQIAEALFSHYLLPFETAALLLTVALVGTVFLAKRRI